MAVTKPLELALCKPIESLDGLDLENYVMEPKLDGFRLQIIIDPVGDIALYTRTNHVATGKLPAVEATLRDFDLALAGTVLDGEAVYLDPEGTPDFNFTARVMGSGVEVARQKQRTARKYVSFMAFDLLYLRGIDCRGYTFKDRRALLRVLVRQLESEHIVLVPQAPPSLAQHRYYTDQFGEGTVVKNLNAVYQAGRSKAMFKWKKVTTEDVVVLGAEPGKGKFEGQVGAVRYGQYGTPSARHECTALCDGELHERGQCSGMDDATRLRISRKMPLGRVMEITHNGVLAKGGFRHPQFLRWRDDKRPEDCGWS